MNNVERSSYLSFRRRGRQLPGLYADFDPAGGRPGIAPAHAGEISLAALNVRQRSLERDSRDGLRTRQSRRRERRPNTTTEEAATRRSLPQATQVTLKTVTGSPPSSHNDIKGVTIKPPAIVLVVVFQAS